MYAAVDVREDNSERVRYNSPDMPVYAKLGKLSYFQNMAAVSHWHNDLEFLVVLSGHMDYNINGNIYTLSFGDGVFVNSQQLHHGYSADGSDCEFICVLLHPMLISTSHFVEQTYITPVVTNSAWFGKVLSHAVQWENEIIDDISRIYQYCSFREKASDLMIQSLSCHVWALLFQNMTESGDALSMPSHQLKSLRNMVGFIQKHYNEKITISNVAAAGNVCPSSCFLIFNKFLRQTPVNYLTNYRLDKSVMMLGNPDKSIADVAFDVGFSGASYYTETFRKHFGCTPKEYRRTANQESI